jgi:hypothetical protein
MILKVRGIQKNIPAKLKWIKKDIIKAGSL